MNELRFGGNAMDKTQQFTIDLPIDVSATLCRQAIKKFARNVIQDTDDLISFEDPHAAKKLTCAIGLRAQSPTSTVVTIVERAVMAFGPLWEKFIDKRISEYRKEIDSNYEAVKKTYEAAKKIWQAKQQQLIRAGLKCPTCGKAIPEGTRFCPNDGTPIALLCSKCGHGNTPSSKFCVNCGEPL
jgi:hypothetical protein